MTKHLSPDERTDALARDDQALRPQRGHGLPHDRAADTHGAHHLLLRGQARAGLEPPVDDFLLQPIHRLAREIARRRQPMHRELVSRASQC